MCKHGTVKYIKLNKPRPSGKQIVPVDACIANEVQMLNDKNVITYGCCCGHFERDPECLVDIKSKEILEQLGYELKCFDELHNKQRIYEILLKTGDRR